MYIKEYIMPYRLILVMCILHQFCNTNARTSEEILSGDVSILYTADNYTYNNFYLEVLERNYVVFKVKACSDAHVALLDKEEGNEVIEVVLGGWSNSLSKIRYNIQGETLTEAYTPDILHCAEFRTFWIHWSSRLSVGRGSKYYQQEIFSTSLTHHYFDINFVAMSTGFGHTGSWEIEQGYAYHLFVRTPDIFPEAFEYVTRSVERVNGFFTFHAQACHDLHIAMGESIHEWDYRVNFCGWENTKTCVFHDGAVKCANNTDVCQCGELKPFWISWKEGIIRVGQGQRIHESTLLEYSPSNWKTITYLSFSTGWGAEGIWMFNDDLENSWSLTGTNYGDVNVFENWLGTSKHHFIPFSVEACGDVYLSLSSEMGESENAFVIFISKGNMTTGISKGIEGEALITVDTPNMLNCEYALPFWISYYEKTIRLGRGLNYGWNQLLEYSVTEDVFDVLSVGLGTQGSKVIWNVKKNHADMFYSLTPPEYRARNVWMTVKQDFVCYMYILGRKDAVVFLSETPGYPDEYGYELIFGYDTTKMLMRQKRGDEYSIITETEVGEVLSETEWRMFWVSWKDGYIMAGAGWQYGKTPLIQTAIYVPHAVNGLGITSIADILQWEFESEQGDFFSMRTDTHDASREFGYRWAHIYTHDDGYWLYFQVSGGAACLCLSTKYGDADGSYIVHLGAEDNTKVQMWKYNGNLVSEIIDPGVMHPDQMRVFWVSWQSGEIKFGKGRYKNRNVLVSHKDNSFGNIEAIGMGGLNNYIANWRFGERQGLQEFSYKTNDLEDNQQIWLSLTRKTDMVFSVQACKEVHLWFGSIMYSESWYDSYLIVLQNGSDYSYISTPWQNGQGMNRKIEIQMHTPGLLSCDEERIFWVSWLKRELIIGSGGYVGENILMSIHHFDAIPIRAFSAHTYSTTGKFRFPISSHSFTENEIDSTTSSLSAGEIVAVVIGFLLLTTLFIGAIYIIMKPPTPLQKYLSPPPITGTNKAGAGKNSGPINFDNPLTTGP